MLVQVYGSSTISCNHSLNLTNLTNCDDERSSMMDTATTDNTETFLIIPDISPTDEDLGDATTGGDLGTKVNGADDGNDVEK